MTASEPAQKSQTRKQIARSRALQAIYEWQLSGNSLTSIERSFEERGELAEVNREFFNRLLHQIPAALEAIDLACRPYLGQELNQINPVELAAIRIGAYELLYSPELPYRVAISEAVELAKVYGAEQGHRFVNGVLHGLAKVVRAVEVEAAAKTAPKRRR